MKIVLIVLIVIIILVIVALGIIGYKGMEFAIVRRPPKPITPPKEDASPVAIFRYEHREAQLQWLEGWGYEKIVLIGRDNKKLVGYYFKAKEPTHRTTLAIHGYRCDGGFEEYMFFAPMYLEKLGMNLLLVDDYAHHNSEGKYIGFGWMDRLDCIQWANWLVEQDTNVEILLQGVSMGAATVLNSGGDSNLPSAVKGIVSDCSFSSTEKEIQIVMVDNNILPVFPFYYVTSLFSKLFAGYFFSEGDVVASTSRIKLPVLFIHGEEDKFVPTNMVYQLHDACTSKKFLLTVPNAAHAESFLTDQLTYLNAVKQLIDASF